MFNPKLLICLLLTLSALKAMPAVFVVTSNADSGPGTLRDALTLAANNNSADIDYINFNLPDQSEAGRTIKLLTELPAVSSNIVIDGTTQPGNKFGVSDAHIKIETPQTIDLFTVFNLNGAQAVALYGLFIYDYTGTQNPIAGLKKRVGINMLNANNITIGAPTKGNVIRGFAANTIYGKSSTLISIGSNFIGLDAAQSNYTDFSGPLALTDCDKITIGGDLNSNVIFCHTTISMINLVKTFTIDVNYNNWGVFKDGKTFDPAFLLPSFLRIYTEQSAIPGPAISATANVNIKNNVAANLGTTFAIDELKGQVVFQKNYMGIAKDEITPLRGNNPVADGGIGIRVEFSLAQIIVGGETLAEKNYFAFMSVGLYAGFSSNVFVRNNEYQCIAQTAYLNKVPASIPPIRITSRAVFSGHTILTGTAEPNAIIDIYSSEGCASSACSIRKHIETLAADDDGNWTSDQPGLSGNFYVSSTVNLKTSSIKPLEVNVDNVNVTYSSCTATGNITGLQVPAGLSYHWEDDLGNTVSTDLDLHVLHPGKYRLVLGDGCNASDFFQVDAQNATQFPLYTNVTRPACVGETNGSIVVTINPVVKSARWTNSLGVPVGNGPSLQNVGPGTYNLYLTDAGNCEVLYKSYIVAAIPPLQIVTGSAVVVNDECNLKTGSIKNVQVTGGKPPYTYSWVDAQNNAFSSTKEVQGLIDGNYTLNVTDDQGCALASATYNIQIQNDVIPPPVVNDVKVCVLGSEVLLVVSDTAAKYTYHLYDTNNSPTPLDVQASGRFKITTKVQRNYYVSQVSGTCESDRTEVAVTEGLTINIANAFTPNNDGINDFWKISGIENALSPTVQLFNRYGHLVFESKGYTQPFDGTSNGKQLPVGTYYYIINLSSNCKLLSGGVTIIR
jgi:gliding motility-associated-like protein